MFFNQDQKQKERIEAEQLLGASLITHSDPRSVIAEQFRTLRTNIQFAQVDRDLQTLMVTSSKIGEGKSTITLNLANVMADTGERVLLIDADLRKSNVHRALDLPNKVGLSSVLAQQVSLDEAVISIPSLNLDVLTGGPIPPNPAEMLGSSRMGEMMEELKQRYDLIVFDAPPVTAITDAQILGSRVDGTVIVARQNYARRDEIQKAVELLRLANANIIGGVLNDVEVDSDSSYYYYGSDQE